MLLSEFLGIIERSGLPWQITKGGHIRSDARFMRDAVDMTPLVWVALRHTGKFFAANEMLGFTKALEMDVALVSRIWTATETPLGKDSLRPLLLKACKLEGV